MSDNVTRLPRAYFEAEFGPVDHTETIGHRADTTPAFLIPPAPDAPPALKLRPVPPPPEAA